MSRPRVRRETVEVVDVPLGGNVTLRVALTRDGDGEPDALVLSAGFGGGASFHRPPWADEPPLRLPGSKIGELRDALKSLEETE